MSAPPSRSPVDARLAALEPEALAHALADIGLEPDAVGHADDPQRGGGRALLLALEAGEGPSSPGLTEAARRADRALAEDGALLLFLYGRRSDAELARVRNALWPGFHMAAIYELETRTTRRRTLQGTVALEAAPEKASRAHTGRLLVLRRTRHVLSPEATVEKFDQNASGWNGEPGGPGYAHFRWMRRHVARFADAPRGVRVLDFGSGAGWVGIEAARRFGARELCLFDPSPEMVRIAEENARREGIERVVGRTGFGEDPPFPGPGEEPFELVISSGVASFSPDLERWFDGLARTVAPGGELVIGDIHRESRGFRRRRAERPLLPVRELNALTREEARAQLERRGFVHEASAGYQLTRPVPQLMHLNETRLFGLLSRPLVWTNRVASALLGGGDADRFDSWVMRLRRPAAS